jgi:thiamine biosynthesis lipoprotein
MQADALATALTVLGPDAGFDYAQARGLAARFVVRGLRQIDERMTTAFAAMLK